MSDGETDGEQLWRAENVPITSSLLVNMKHACSLKMQEEHEAKRRELEAVMHNRIKLYTAYSITLKAYSIV